MEKNNITIERGILTRNVREIALLVHLSSDQDSDRSNQTNLGAFKSSNLGWQLAIWKAQVGG